MVTLTVRLWNMFPRFFMQGISCNCGTNGTGKTTLLRDVIKGENPAIRLGENVKMAYLSQMHGGI